MVIDVVIGYFVTICVVFHFLNENIVIKSRVFRLRVGHFYGGKMEVGAEHELTVG